MDNILKLSMSEKEELFTETAAQMGLRPSAVEKDFWISWTLKELFSTPSIKNTIMFKGGTSLSKVFHLIKRFSEDIDLVLDWRTLGITDELAWEKRSRTQQQKFNNEMNAKAQKYLRQEFTPKLQKIFAEKINDNEFKLICKEQQIIKFYYPRSIHEESYVKPEIQLEIGPVASWQPSHRYKIESYASKKFKDLFHNPSVKVFAIDAERTFWEKATILHQEAHRKSKLPPIRYSRHFYDLYVMSQQPVKNKALLRLDLLKDVVEFKTKFYYSSWAKYDLAKVGTFRLVPPERLIKHFEDDYAKMNVMIFGDYPAFAEILQGLQKLEDEINNLRETYYNSNTRIRLQ